jgi:hypothetical protein
MPIKPAQQTRIPTPTTNPRPPDGKLICRDKHGHGARQTEQHQQRRPEHGNVRDGHDPTLRPRSAKGHPISPFG